MRKELFRVLLACAFLAVAAPAWAQNFPNRPIRIIVAVTPGGGLDLFGRIIGQKLQERLGQPVIVENKPGAGGITGVEFAAKSVPDGYTLLVMTNAFSMVPWASKSLPYDFMKDFAPIGIGATTPVVVVVTEKLPLKSINELIAYAKANPGKLSYATPGVGTLHHLVTELFMDMTGTKMFHVPYKGASAGMLADLMSGEVHVVFSSLGSAFPSSVRGKIRLIGVAEHQRLPQFRDVPTVNESLPGYEVNFWYGLLAPAGTPEPILNLLAEEQRTILNMPEVRERLAGVGFDTNPTFPAEMRQIMAAEIAKWAKVVKAAGMNAAANQPQ